MAGWDWLIKPETPYTWRFARNVLIKGVILFAAFNLLFALIHPTVLLGRLSWYGIVAPGRDRLPYGENPDDSYNLSLQNLDALFASHEITVTPKAADEYRVLLIGDSSVWGVLLKPDETLSAYLNAAHYHTPSGKHVRVYNIGYPVQSLAKDVLLLNYALRYQPDLIVWMITLESFAPDSQLAAQMVKENPDTMRRLISIGNIKSINSNDPQFVSSSFLEQTIVGQRRPLADLLRLQLYGPTWGITGIDQTYPNFYQPRQQDFDTDVTWHGMNPQPLTTSNITFDMLQAGYIIAAAAKVPVVTINEPIFISAGVNSNLRYDRFYPRWSYDSYRLLLPQFDIIDLWNLIPFDQFTDSPVHLTPAGSRTLAGRVGSALMEVAAKG